VGLKHHSQIHATLLTLADAARWKMDKDTDLAWLDQVHTVMGFLRSAGVLPVTRCSINGHLHSLFSAMIVEAHVWAGDTVYVHTRKLSTLAAQGISTHMLGWLDHMVQAGLLHSPQQGKANGAVRLSGRLLRHLQ
jgi:hypothetical protein